MRQLKITRNFLTHPEGSVLIELGDTKVICTASVENSVPQFLKDSNQGWVTAEYGMLPRSTGVRNRRESAAGKISGRTAEIQRLIGRSLRSVSDLTLFPGYSVLIDCDVIQADGGTRTAAITGACVALYDAFDYMLKEGIVGRNPLVEWAAAISVGIVDGKPYLDLDYLSDSSAETDMNVVMTESGKYIEIQGTAEKKPFTSEQLTSMLKLAESGIIELIQLQKQITEL